MFVSNVIIGLFGIILYLIIYLDARRLKSNSVVESTFRLFLLISVFYSVTDTATWLFLVWTLPSLVIYSWIVNLLCLSVMTILSYSWFCYAMLRIVGVSENLLKRLRWGAVSAAAIIL
jgi:hypothetical protein